MSPGPAKKPGSRGAGPRSPRGPVETTSETHDRRRQEGRRQERRRTERSRTERSGTELRAGPSPPMPPQPPSDDRPRRPPGPLPAASLFSRAPIRPRDLTIRFTVAPRGRGSRALFARPDSPAGRLAGGLAGSLARRPWTSGPRSRGASRRCGLDSRPQITGGSGTAAPRLCSTSCRRPSRPAPAATPPTRGAAHPEDDIPCVQPRAGTARQRPEKPPVVSCMAESRLRTGGHGLHRLLQTRAVVVRRQRVGA